MNPDAVSRHLAFAIAALAAVCAAPGTRAQDGSADASAWEGELHAAARLIGGAAGGGPDSKWLRAGLEIRLDPGWKTYWRYPGDSGVPPTLDFSGSGNVKSVTTLWPAPERFGDGAGGQSIGYRGDVVLPLHVVPEDTNRPVRLRVKVGYAVCGKLCIPAEADLGLTLSGKTGPTDAALDAAEARVPRAVPLGTKTGGLSVSSIRRENIGGQDRIVVEVAAPPGAPVDLFVEGPTRDWALPLPEPKNAPTGGAPGARQFTFALDGLPHGASADGAMLKFTTVSPTDAIEVKAHLD